MMITPFQLTKFMKICCTSIKISTR